MPLTPVDPKLDDVTGSLPDVPFGGLLEREDQRRERAALATALDPQGDGSVVTWANPTTKTSGAITARGHAYPADDKVCRSFVSTLAQGATKQRLEGIACTDHGGEWTLRHVSDARKD